MRNIPPFVAILLFPFVTHVASAKPAPSASPSGAKKWSPPDVSVKLQTSGKPTPSASPSGAKNWSPPDISVRLQTDGRESASAKKSRDLLSAAARLYRDKHYAEAASEYEKCVEIDYGDFRAHLFLGFSYYHLRRFDDAAKALRRACDLNPEDFDANLWLGVNLDRTRAFKEAVSRLEKAHELKPDNTVASRELFIAYLGVGELEKAGALYPRVVRMIGGVFGVVYCVWLAALLPFSLLVRSRMFPGLVFSFAWLGLYVEGQIAFLLILVSMPWLGLHETILTGAAIAGLPIIAVALIGFARQPWGEPFRWPPRFGSAKTILISVLLIFLTLLVANAFAQLYVHATNKPFPLQRTIPLMRNALRANPVAAWIGIAFIIPCVEEILFRGLLFGAFQKMWGVAGAILASSFLFVCVHLQIIGFLALFLVAVILGWARLRSGSLGLPIVLHSLNNAIAMAVLTFGPPPPTS